jgi:endonuclease III
MPPGKEAARNPREHPTPAECEEVNRLLASVHGEIKAPAALPNPSLTISGCGEVPCVLDALLRTVLSGATTKGNSGKAFEGLVKRFGVKEAGIGKGSVDWEKVRNASVEEVEEAIKSGGLAAIKSKNIKLILDMVYEENLKRQTALAETPKADGDKEVITSVALATTEPTVAADLLSLNHVHTLSKDEAMLEFVKYPGIGVKTAACVVLFSLQRPCFAVDTHVFRLSKWLGWLPQDKRVDEITAFRHLEVLVPDHLKYALHQLFLEHGKTCPRCRASTGDNTDSTCVIDHLIAARTGKRKGKNGFRQTHLSF